VYVPVHSIPKYFLQNHPLSSLLHWILL
jgi:hypothetical protein